MMPQEVITLEKVFGLFLSIYPELCFLSLCFLDIRFDIHKFKIYLCPEKEG